MAGGLSCAATQGDLDHTFQRRCAANRLCQRRLCGELVSAWTAIFTRALGTVSRRAGWGALTATSLRIDAVVSRSSDPWRRSAIFEFKLAISSLQAVIVSLLSRSSAS